MFEIVALFIQAISASLEMNSFLLERILQNIQNIVVLHVLYRNDRYEVRIKRLTHNEPDIIVPEPAVLLPTDASLTNINGLTTIPASSPLGDRTAPIYSVEPFVSAQKTSKLHASKRFHKPSHKPTTTRKARRSPNPLWLLLLLIPLFGVLGAFAFNPAMASFDKYVMPLIQPRVTTTSHTTPYTKLCDRPVASLHSQSNATHTAKTFSDDPQVACILFFQGNFTMPAYQGEAILGVFHRGFNGTETFEYASVPSSSQYNDIDIQGYENAQARWTMVVVFADPHANYNPHDVCAVMITLYPGYPNPSDEPGFETCSSYVHNH